MVRLSVLDQSPVSSGSTGSAALADTVALAQAVERLGYSRFWLAEHHGSPGLAGTAPEVMVARVASATSTIRVGAGAVLLSHYSPLKVAETFRVLAGLFPRRIDLGIGRADGASPAAVSALQAGVHGGAGPFGRKLADLLSHLGGSDPAVRAMPEGVDGPDVWLLASSSDGALAAAGLGLPLCFAQFISPGFGPQIVARYRRDFSPVPLVPPDSGPRPTVAVAVAVICATTDAEAERLAAGVDGWRLTSEEERGPVPPVAAGGSRVRSDLEQARVIQNRKRLIVGGPDRVADALQRLAHDFEAEELVVLTVCHDPRDRLRSYELLAGCFGLPRP